MCYIITQKLPSITNNMTEKIICFVCNPSLLIKLDKPREVRYRYLTNACLLINYSNLFDVMIPSS